MNLFLRQFSYSSIYLIRVLRPSLEYVTRIRSAAGMHYGAREPECVMVGGNWQDPKVAHDHP